MPSPASPKPNFQVEVLETTLVAVRRRRHRRQQVVLSSAATLMLTSIGFLWWTTTPSSSRLQTGGTQVDPPSRPARGASIRFRHIETLPERDAYRFISYSSGAPSTVISIDPAASADSPDLDVVSDDEFLAQLPPEKPAALVWDPDGKSRLVWLPSL